MVQRPQQHRLPRIRRTPSRGQSELALPCGGSQFGEPQLRGTLHPPALPSPTSLWHFPPGAWPRRPRRPQAPSAAVSSATASPPGWCPAPASFPPRTACCPCSGPWSWGPRPEPPQPSLLWVPASFPPALPAAPALVSGSQDPPGPPNLAAVAHAAKVTQGHWGRSPASDPRHPEPHPQSDFFSLSQCALYHMPPDQGPLVPRTQSSSRPGPSPGALGLLLCGPALLLRPLGPGLDSSPPMFLLWDLLPGLSTCCSCNPWFVQPNFLRPQDASLRSALLVLCSLPGLERPGVCLLLLSALLDCEACGAGISFLLVTTPPKSGTVRGTVWALPDAREVPSPLMDKERDQPAALAPTVLGAAWLESFPAAI